MQGINIFFIAQHVDIYIFNLTCFRESLCKDENLNARQEKWSLIEPANCYLLELLINYNIAFSYIMQNIAGTVIHL